MPLDEKNVYALDEGKNSWLTMTKEQILTAITQAVNEGTISDIDAGFITKLQEMNAQGVVQFWFGTMAEFQALTDKDENTLYLFTDDPTVDDIEQAITELEEKIEDMTDGTTAVENAKNVNNLEIKRDENGVLKIGNTIIPQKKVLWTGEAYKSAVGDNVELELNDTIAAGDTIEIICGYNLTGDVDTIDFDIHRYKLKAEEFTSRTVSINGIADVKTNSNTQTKLYSLWAKFNSNKIIFTALYCDPSNTSSIGTDSIYIKQISKIIE